jgi:ADP-heptose:LPS heptosyltransferase
MASQNTREIKTVLVIQLSALGAFVMSLAAMKRIREAHPKAKITLLTTPPFEGLAKSSPYFNTVETDGRPEGLGDFAALISRLRAAKYDRIYDLETSSRSNAIYRFMGPFQPPWSGIAPGCAFRQRGRAREHMHILERQADQLRIAGVWDDAPTAAGTAPPPDLSWILRKAPPPRPVAGGVKPRPFVLMVPGGSARHKDKRWPVDYFTDLAAILRAQGFDIVVIGGPEESALARAIQRKSQARDLTGRTDFSQIAILAARSALAVGNDTGPLNLIAAAGAPTLALFSKASDPLLRGPRGHVTMMRADNLKDLPVAEVARACQHLMPAEARPS